MRSNKEIFEAVLRRYENPTGDFFGICAVIYDEVAKEGFSTSWEIQKGNRDAIQTARDFYAKIYGRCPSYIGYWWSYPTLEENMQVRRDFLRQLIHAIEQGNI